MQLYVRYHRNDDWENLDIPRIGARFYCPQCIYNNDQELRIVRELAIPAALPSKRASDVRRHWKNVHKTSVLRIQLRETENFSD